MNGQDQSYLNYLLEKERVGIKVTHKEKEATLAQEAPKISSYTDITHQQNTMKENYSMSFLPEDYEAPRTAGNYMKITEGDWKIRILTSPVWGWEEWSDSKSYRYRPDEKPKSWINPANPGKFFWAMLVWNYNVSMVQVLQISQASIRRDIEALIKDSDWGSPFAYDIKISRSGKSQNDTKYTLRASPHSPVADHIKETFLGRRCYLPVWIDGLDPFDCGDDYTKAAFETGSADVSRPVSKTITGAQYTEIMELIGDDIDYEKELTANLSKVMNIKSLKDLPANRFDSLLKSVKIHSDERVQREMTSGVPF